MSCNGRCCAVFTYPLTPTQLGERNEGDDSYIADMLIELTGDEAQLRASRFEIGDNIVGGPHYTCRYWNEETRLCGNYENRPRMCREYPYGRICDHGCGCYAEPHTRVKFAGIAVRNYKPRRMLNA